MGAISSMRHRAEDRNNSDVHEASLVRAEQIASTIGSNSGRNKQSRQNGVMILRNATPDNLYLESSPRLEISSPNNGYGMRLVFDMEVREAETSVLLDVSNVASPLT